MQYITFTELRNKSHNLFRSLEGGQEVRLVRKSRIVGRIIPERDISTKTIDAEKLQAKIDQLSFPRLTLREIDRRYRIAMMKKHGQGLSRH